MSTVAFNTKFKLISDTILIYLNPGFLQRYENSEDYRELVTFLSHELGHIFFRDVFYLKSINGWDSKMLNILRESRADIFSYYFSSYIFYIQEMEPVKLEDYNWFSDCDSSMDTYLLGYLTVSDRRNIIKKLIEQKLNGNLVFDKSKNDIYYTCYNREIRDYLLKKLNGLNIPELINTRMMRLLNSSNYYELKNDCIKKYINRVYKLKKESMSSERWNMLQWYRYYCICDLLCINY